MQRRRRGAAEDMLAGYLGKWKLEPDGERIATPSSLLQPVRAGQARAMLNILRPQSDEDLAHRALRIWRGAGAVRLLRWDDHAQLLERLEGDGMLVDMALRGDDDEAVRIIARIADKLHRHGRNGLPRLGARLRVIFRYSNPDAQALVQTAREIYHELGNPGSEGPFTLHGDLHHSNVMSRRGEFVAIDPKGIGGDRTYDLANVLLNPYPHRDLVLDRQRMRQRVDIITEILDLDPCRLLQSTVVHGCAAASWSAGDAEAESWWLDGAALAKSLLESLDSSTEIPFVAGAEEQLLEVPVKDTRHRGRDDDEIPF